MMSPLSSSGTSLFINASTTSPARTINMILRGDSNLETKSSNDVAPMMLVSFAGPSRNSSTLETVRLNATTLKPWSFILRIKF